MVIDASVAVKWVVPEAGSDAAIALLGRELWAPSLWLAEAANALRTKSRRGEIPRTRRACGPKTSSMRRSNRSILLPSAMRMAGELGHSIYDCFYLAAALLRDTTLVTADCRFAAKVAGHSYFAVRVDLLSGT